MKLYHGTTSAHATAIMINGIRPRMARNSNWDKHPSRPDMVYLTRAYAPFYAMSAINDEHERAALFEVDADKLNHDLIYPDEDFINQAGEVHPSKYNETDLEEHRHHWRDSIRHLGNAAYKGWILPEAITLAVLFDFSTRPWLAMLCDPIITLTNYKLLGEYYCGVNDWLFGHRPDIPIQLGFENDPERQAYWEQESKNRDGILLWSSKTGTVEG